jgi:hypothetical protein
VRIVLLIWLFTPLCAYAQELFPNTEPASTIPKGVIGLRYSLEAFNSNTGKLASWHSLKCMYGATSRLTIIGSVSASNLHTKKFPEPFTNNFTYHHSPVSYQSGTAKVSNPFLIEGITLYGKYRFFSKDAEHSHWRIAAYGEFSKSFVAHREAEPSLNGNNTGAGAGFIITKLHKKLALSGTVGYIYPFKYEEKDSLISFRSGNTFIYNISVGYLLFPLKYKSYKDLNVNLYVECMNKIYEEAAYVHHALPVNSDFYPVLMGGQYSEVRPAIQFIINSNTRIDASVSFPVYQQVETRTYPVYMINIQRYFYKS